MPVLISHRFHRGVGWCLVAVVVALSLARLPELPQVTDSYDDKIQHYLMYALLMAWFAVITPRAAWLRLACAVIGLGIALEFCQALLPYRTASFVDAIANTLGVLTGAGLARLAAACGADPVASGSSE